MTKRLLLGIVLLIVIAFIGASSVVADGTSSPPPTRPIQTAAVTPAVPDTSAPMAPSIVSEHPTASIATVVGKDAGGEAITKLDTLTIVSLKMEPTKYVEVRPKQDLGDIPGFYTDIAGNRILCKFHWVQDGAEWQRMEKDGVQIIHLDELEHVMANPAISPIRVVVGKESHQRIWAKRDLDSDHWYLLPEGAKQPEAFWVVINIKSPPMIKTSTK